MSKYTDISLKITDWSEFLSVLTDDMITEVDGVKLIKQSHLNPIPIVPEAIPQVLSLRARPETIEALVANLPPSVTIIATCPEEGEKYEDGVDSEDNPIYKFKKLRQIIKDTTEALTLYSEFYPPFSEFIQDEDGIDILFDEPELDADGKEIKIDKLDKDGKIVYELDAEGKKIKNPDGTDKTVKETKMIKVKKNNPEFGTLPGPGGFM